MSKFNKWFMFWAIFIPMIFFGMYEAWGETFTYPIRVSNDANFDSSWVVIYRDGAVYDSAMITTDSTMTFDNEYTWGYVKIDYWDGIAYGYPDPLVPISKYSKEAGNTNLVVNGSFEDGLNGSFPIGWRWTYGVDSSGSGLSTLRASISSGKYSYRMTSSTDSMWLSQRDSLYLSSGYYNISYFVLDTNFSSVEIRGTSTVYSKTLSTERGYISEVFYAPSGKYQLRIGSAAGSNTIYFDNISLVKLSEQYAVVSDTTIKGDTIATKKDSSIFQGLASSLDTSQIKAMMANNFLPYNNIKYRYVDADASGSNTGLNWTDAWTHPDSVSTITTGSGYTIFVDADDYDPVDACSLQVDYMTMIGVNGTPIFHYNTDTTAAGVWDSTGGADVSDCIYINNLFWRIENIKFTGEGLYAYPHYGVDPDADSLSITNRGGKNAIFIDTGGDYGTVFNCLFDSAYKPIAGYYRADSMRTANYAITIENNVFRDIEYHCIDAPLAYSVVRGNTMIKTNTSGHPAAGAVQLISRIGAYNMVYDNYIHGFGYALYANVSDSNFFANNYLGSEILPNGTGEAMRVYDTGYYDPMAWFVGNNVADWVKAMPVEGGRNILPNSGFEIEGHNRHDPALWKGNDWSVANKDSGASLYIAPIGYANPNVDSRFSDGKDGHSLFMMNGVGDKYFYQNSDIFYLDAGEVQFSAKVLPNSPIVSGDTVRFALFEDTLNDGTFSLYSDVYYFISDGGTAWELASYNFTIDNPGEYYFSMSNWNVDSGDGFYYDDVFLGQYSGQVTASASITATDKAEIAGYVDDTLTANHGSGSWSASTGSGPVTIRIEATDTTGSDSILTANVVVAIRTLGGVLDAVQTTNSGGYIDFTLPADSMVMYGYLSGYLWFTDTIVVSVQDTVILYGQDIFNPPTPPSGANLCTVYGWVRGYTGLAKKYVEVKLTTPQATYNLCDSTILIPQTFMIEINDTGYFAKDVIKSSCMDTLRNGDLQDYKISIPGFRNTEHKFSIPSDSDTYRIIF